MTGAQIIASGATKAWAAGQWLLNAALSANPIGLVVVGIAALIAILVLAWKNSDTFRRIVTGAFGAVKDFASNAFGWIKDHWPLLLAILVGPFGLAVLAVAKHWDSIVATVSGMPGRISKAAAGMWNGITAAFKSAINAIIDGWNSLDFTVPKVHVKGTNIDFGGFTVGMPDIPHLADGGIVKATPGGRLILAGEGGRDEAIVPLNRFPNSAFANPNQQSAQTPQQTIYFYQTFNNPVPERASVDTVNGIRRASYMLGRP
jgi:hypothetical protein